MYSRLSLVGLLLCLCIPQALAEKDAPATQASSEPEPWQPLPEARLQIQNRQLADKLDDEAIWWLDEKQQILALYQPEHTGNPQGAVILLSDLGQHAHWPGLQHTLREQLPWEGWHSLSISLPLANAPAITPQDSPPIKNSASEAAEDTPPTPEAMQIRAPLHPQPSHDARKQIIFALLDSARAQLQAKNLANQAIIAEGEALWWATYWLTERTPAEIGSLVMLTPKTPPLEKAPQFNALLAKLKISQQLDIIRRHDDPKKSQLREAAARRQAQNYQRMTLSGHDLKQQAKRIHSWLSRYMSGSEQTFR